MRKQPAMSQDGYLLIMTDVLFVENTVSTFESEYLYDYAGIATRVIEKSK
jgi:hypothetical protein